MNAYPWKTALGALTVASLLLGAPGEATAEDAYPTKAIQLVVPYNAGGDTDLVARVFANEFQKALHQPVVVVNVSGGSGSIATTKVKNSPPDGYTLLLHHSGILGSMLTGAIDFSYRDLSVLGSVGLSEGTIWVTGANSPYKNMHDLVEAAKARPGAIQNGVNFGSQSHVHEAAFEDAAGVRLHNVDVGGISEKIVAILGGHIDVTEVQVGTVKAYLDAGTMRTLGTTADTRYEGLPDVKTFREQGIDVAMPDRIFWVGMPANAPANVVATLTDALKKTAAQPGIKADFAKIMITPLFKNAAETTAALDHEYEFLSKYKHVFLTKPAKK